MEKTSIVIHVRYPCTYLLKSTTFIGNSFFFSVFGLDYVIKDNRTKFALPKYNNKVQNPDMFDQETQIYLPHSLFNQPSMKGMNKKQCTGTYFFLIMLYLLVIFK